MKELIATLAASLVLLLAVGGHKPSFQDGEYTSARYFVLAKDNGWQVTRSSYGHEDFVCQLDKSFHLATWQIGQGNKFVLDSSVSDTVCDHGTCRTQVANVALETEAASAIKRHLASEVP